jgi:hypothetical protein
MTEKTKNLFEVVVLLLTKLTSFSRIVSVSDLHFYRTVSVSDRHFYTKIQRELSENIFTHCAINAYGYSCIYKKNFYEPLLNIYKFNLFIFQYQ